MVGGLYSSMQLILTQNKLVFTTAIAAIFDILIALILALFLKLASVYFYVGESVGFDLSNGVTWFLRDIFGYAALVYFANIILIISSWRSTFGMKVVGLRIYSYSGGRPSFFQASLYLISSPTFLPFIILNVYSWSADAPLNLYYLSNALTIMVVCQVALVIFYTAVFGSVLHLRLKLSGLSTHSKAAQQPFARPDLVKVGGAERVIPILLLTILIYFPITYLIGLLKEPVPTHDLYALNEISWGDDNAYFALIGLTAPPEVHNSYEFGRGLAFKSFLQMREVKEAVGITNQLDIPVPTSSQHFAFDKKPLNFEGNHNAFGQMDDFECLDAVNYEGSFKCIDPDRISLLIHNNSDLWMRFNAIPDYKVFSALPSAPSSVNLGKYLARGPGRASIIDSDIRRPYSLAGSETLISLARLKIGEIILLQREVGSEIAFYEWARFMSLYRKMIQAKVDTESKAASVILYGMHLSALEALLYADPGIAIKHFDEIDSVLRFQDIAKYRASSILADSYSSLEPLLIYEVGVSSTVQAKMQSCLRYLKDQTFLSAKVFFNQGDYSSFCQPRTAANSSDFIYDLIFDTSGNPVSNWVWGITYVDELRALKLIENMHIQVAEVRMARLGAEILSKKIPVKKIKEFVQGVPVEMQNPLSNAPFNWSEDGSYLWFEKPTERDYQMKYHLNLRDHI